MGEGGASFSDHSVGELLSHSRRLSKTLINATVIVLLSILTISLLPYSFMGVAKATEEVEMKDFSVIQISDTQYLSSSYPSLWRQLANWVVANNASYNIKMVVHTGDIVDHGETLSQWDVANSSMSLLLNAHIAYTWNAGNHDQNSTADGRHPGTPDGDWIGSRFLAFNATYMRSKPYWVSDINDGKDTAVQFKYGNTSFLIINLEFHANQTAIDWLTNLIDTHPTYKVIIATHSYLNGLQCYGYPYSPDSPAWENNLITILNNYSNVFLTISGHYIHTIYPTGDEETSNYTRINTREETFFNRQMALGAGGPGADSARIFTFNMTNSSNPRIHVSTYDVYSSTWKNDSWDDFSFQANARAQATDQPSPVDAVVHVPLITPKPAFKAVTSPKPVLASPTPSVTCIVPTTVPTPPITSIMPTTAPTTSQIEKTIPPLSSISTAPIIYILFLGMATIFIITVVRGLRLTLKRFMCKFLNANDH